MRDYALNRARGAEASGTVSLLRTILANWRARLAVQRLDTFDDYLLRDIGLTREDVRWAVGLPLSLNADLELEERTGRRTQPRP